MISIKKDVEFSLCLLEYGVDTKDDKRKYFATYSAERDGLRIFAEIKSEKAIIFKEKVRAGQLMRHDGGVRFKVEGDLDYGDK